MTALLEFIDVFNEIVANPDPDDWASCWVKHLIMMPVYNCPRIIKFAQLHAHSANTQACWTCTPDFFFDAAALDASSFSFPLV